MSEETKKSWDKNEVFALISDWELLPELWDVKSKVFRNRIKKQNALQKLADTFSTTTNEIARKLHNLRTQVHSEMRKIKTKHSGDGADDTYESTWEFFDVLKFIRCEHTNPTTTDNMNNEAEQQYDETTENNDNTTEHKETAPEKQSKKRGKRSEPDYDLLLKKAAYVMNKPADEFQIFGDYVTSELRNLRSAENQRKLKLDIQRALIRASEINITGSSTPQSNASFSRATTPNSSSVASYLSEFEPYEERPHTAPGSIQELFGQSYTLVSETGTLENDTNLLQQL